LRVALLAVLLLPLGGCFVSPAPLIAAAEADHPLAASRGEQFAWDSGSWKSRGAVTLSIDGPYYVLTGRERGDVSHFLLKQLDGNSYVAQSEEKSRLGDLAYIYALVVIDGGRITVNSFLDESTGCKVPGIAPGALGLRPSDDGCTVPSFAALSDVFRALRQSSAKPETLYVTAP
jgi:hypothetical protein